MRKRILVMADWFPPGYKAGGPIRSCLHFVQRMKDKYECFVFTSDRDHGEFLPYKNVEIDRWTDFEPGVQVYYASPGKLSWKNILQQSRDLQPDFIYLNSMYSKFFTIYPLMMARLGLIRAKIVLSPRGMLRESAIQFRRSKKKLFLTLLRTSGVHKLVHFHATDDTEQNDIRKQFGKGITVTMAPNLAAMVGDYPGSKAKKEGELSIIFVGRLHPIKNLDYLLNILPLVSGNIGLTIAGSEEDKNYVIACKGIVANFPQRIKVHFAGELPNNQVPGLVRQHHIFALPTRGENFGHAIFEALAAGRPVLISDQTPWRQLSANKAGWDIDLKQKELFVGALQQAVDFDQQVYDAWSRGAWQHAQQFAQRSSITNLYYNIFQ
jgi:glycosyltransferase involved in cell wall biosynthesis